MIIMADTTFNRVFTLRHRIIALILIMIASFHTNVYSAELSSVTVVGKTGIQLIAQDIKAVVATESADVSSMLHIIGNGVDKSVEAAFSYTTVSELENLNIYTDNDQLKWRSEKDSDSGSVTVSFTVPCPPKDEYLGIGLTFTVPFASGKYGVEDINFSWDLSPAKSWAGVVKDSRLTIYLRDASYEQISSINPEPISRDNNRIMWQKSKSEPSETVVIAIMKDELYYTLATAGELIEKDPANAHAHFLLGAALFAHSLSGDSNMIEAIDAFEKALSIEADHTGALWFLAVSYHLNDRNADVKSTLETLVSLEPSYHCEHRLFPKALMNELPASSPKAWLDLR